MYFIDMKSFHIVYIYIQCIVL